MSEELIIKEIEANKEEYIEFLRELIKIDTYNPPGNERNVAIKIDKYLKNVGIKCEIFPFGNNRANLFAYLNDNFNGKNLLFNGHMDVVPPGSKEKWKNPPLSAFVKRKKLIYGRGSSDMKGGLTAMVIALKILKKLGLEVSGNLILNAVADEETGGKFGTKWSIENKLKSINCDFVIIGESTIFNTLPISIVLGEKGHLQVKIITNGKSSYSSIPFLGKNAIYMMSEIIQNLDKMEEYIPKIKPQITLEKLKNFLSGVFPNREILEKFLSTQQILQNLLKLLTEFTKSLNIIEGGINESVVPDNCEAVIDFGFVPGQNIEVVMDALRKLINSLGYPIKDELIESSEDIFVYLEVIHKAEASFWKNWEQSQALKNLYNILEKVYKRKPYYFLYPASADSHYFRNSDYCPETILLGPGKWRTAHSVNEYIEIQDFFNAIKVYTLFAYNFLK